MQLLAAIVPAALLVKFGIKEAPKLTNSQTIAQQLEKVRNSVSAVYEIDDSRVDFINMRYWGESPCPIMAISEDQDTALQELSEKYLVEGNRA